MKKVSNSWGLCDLRFCNYEDTVISYICVLWSRDYEENNFLYLCLEVP
jgi:hypothetical protein